MSTDAAVTRITIDPAEVARFVLLGLSTPEQLSVACGVPLPAARRALRSRALADELASIREQIRYRVVDTAARVQQLALDIIEDDLRTRRDPDAAVAAGRMATAMVPKQLEVAATVRQPVYESMTVEEYAARQQDVIIDAELVEDSLASQHEETPGSWLL